MRKSEEESPVVLCNQLEELSEEPPEESVSQQYSESENEDIEQPNVELKEEPTEYASEKTVSQSSSDIESDFTDEPREEPDEDPSGEYLSQPVSETDDNKCHSESVVTCNELEELSEEPPEESVSQQYSESENEDIEQPNVELKEEPTEYASEKTVSQSSSDIESDFTDEPREEPDEDPSGEYVSQPVSETDDNKCHSESVVTCNELEELSEEPPEESVSQQYSESENEDIEQPNEELKEEPTEYTSEKPVSQSSSDIGSDFTDEPREEPDADPSGEYLSQPVSETDDSKCDSESVSNSSKGKKRSLDVTAGDSDSLQVHPSQKKCKQEECLEPDPDIDYALKDLHNESGSPKAFVDAENASDEQNCTGSSGKRRRSRCDTQPEDGGEEGEGDRTSKRRKTRWADEDSLLKMLGPIQLPNFTKDIVTGADSDPEIQELEMMLLEINRKLQGSEIHVDRPEKEISSPPVYDKLGIKMNSRDVKYREKLVQDRQTIISKLIKKNPIFKPPSDFKPSNLRKKLYIPIREYPGHNFIGLIIGPRGNTQKRMEKETGARIVIRGKGSLKEKWAHHKPDHSYNDDLHVLVEADNQRSLDEAVRMVEKLLNPVDERMNKHKLAQLKELAALKGMLRDESLYRECGGQGHKQYVCPSRKSTFEIDLCDICGGSSHPTTNCPLIASTPVSGIDGQCHSVAVIGSGSLSFGTSPVSGSMPRECSNCGLFTSLSYGHFSHPGVSPTPNTEGKRSKEVDNGSLYLGRLPQTMDDNQLRELFSPFGKITEAKVIKDRSTGFSKGYGFVRYDDSTNAAAAVAHMQGQKIDGKSLAVRVARHSANVESSGISLLPKYAGPSPVSQDNGRGPTAWPGLPGSKLPPKLQDSFPKNHGVGLCSPTKLYVPTDPLSNQLLSFYGLSN